MSSLIHEKETLKDKVSIESQDLKYDHQPKNGQEIVQEVHSNSETHEVKSDDVEKAPETEAERKHAHKDIETKLETVNEEANP